MAKDFAGGSVVKNLPASAGDPWIRKIPWRRKQQPTAVFLPGEFHAQRSLGATVHGGGKESETTD